MNNIDSLPYCCFHYRFAGVYNLNKINYLNQRQPGTMNVAFSVGKRILVYRMNNIIQNQLKNKGYQLTMGK